MDALDDLQKVQRVLQNCVNPLQFFSDTEFRNRCRMSKLSFEQLITELNGRHSGKSWALTMVERLYIIIHFLLLTAYRPALGTLFWLIKELLVKLFMRWRVALYELRGRWIKWFDPLITVSDAFYRISNFPGIIGCIDCTHVQIQRPHENNAEDYINHKCTFSINTQVICDHKLQIVDVVCHWPGSVHDARIFDNSVVKHRLEMRQLNGILLADSGYPCRNYIYTPVLQPTVSTTQI